MNVATEIRRVRVFVSSPGDVAPERGRVQAIAAKLNREHEGLVCFEVVLWEEHFYKAHDTFQAQIAPAVACDVVVSIFWTRIGTELPADFARMPDGRPYPSGTAYELLTAVEASRHKGVPDVYVFRKTAAAELPTMDAARRRLEQTQLDALEAFWSQWFRSEQGQFKAAFQTFAGTDEFEEQLEKLLRQWLGARGLLERRLAWPPERGSPFRGLAAFEAEHAAVFFGRERVVDQGRQLLAAAAARGTPFLLIVGASGAGKSSLARAGLTPRLTTPGVVAAIDFWRIARVKPSEGEGGPVMALAAALFAPGALPELAQGDYPEAEALVDNLRRGGDAAARPVLRALARLAEDVRRERHADRPLQGALLLLVDQLEELFAQGVEDAERAAFAETLGRLVASGQVWCVATVRADLYEQLLRQPALKAMKEVGASLDLGPPGPAELAEIVRAPAAAAGLTFERNAQDGALDDRLLADAKTADSLPLLQFTLRQLYEHRVTTDGEVRLTHAAYETLGGLEGAIAQEAERAVAGLPAESLAALPRLLRRLSEPARDGTTLTLRDVPQAATAAEPAEAALVDALLQARILIARADASAQPSVRLAHDAVLVSWPRAHAAAQMSRDFYRVRAEVEDALRRWQAHGRTKDRLIPSGVPLAEADKLVADFGPELPAEMRAYVASSRSRARARQRLVAAAAIFFFALALTATAAGVYAYRAQQEAVRERDKATRSSKLAQQAAEDIVFKVARGLRNTQGIRAETVRKILETAAATFDALAAAAPDDLDVQRSRSVVLNEFGDTYVDLGDLAGALKSFRDSLAIMERLTKADPANATWQRDLSISYDRVGNVLVLQGNLAEALKSYRDSVAISERLAKSDPANTEWQRDLAVSYKLIGDVLVAQGDLAEALKSYQHGLAIVERLAKTDPGNTQWQRDISVSYDTVGNVLMRQGKLAEALQSYRNGLAVAQHLATADPGNTQWQRDLSVSYQKVGDALLEQGDLAEALQSYRDSLAIAERLAEADPGNAQWQRNLEIAYEKVGDVLVAQGNLSEALKSYRDSFGIVERLAKSDPGNTQWQRDLSISHDSIGNVLLAQGNLAEALTSYRAGLAIMERLAATDPGNTEWQRDLSVSYNKVGDVLLAQGTVAEALQSQRNSLAIRERLAKADPSNMQWQRDVATAHEEVGDALVANGDRAGALQSYRDSLAIRERMAEADPDNTQWQRELSVPYERIGDVLVAQGDLAEALKSFRNSLAIRERLAETHPGNTQWQRDLSLSYDRVGDVLGVQGDLAAALKFYRDSLAIRQRLVEVDPGNAQWQRDLAVSHAKLGAIYANQGDLASGLAELRKAREIIARLLALAPDAVQLKKDLAWLDEQIARVEAATQDGGGK